MIKHLFLGLLFLTYKATAQDLSVPCQQYFQINFGNVAAPSISTALKGAICKNLGIEARSFNIQAHEKHVLDAYIRGLDLITRDGRGISYDGVLKLKFVAGGDNASLDALQGFSPGKLYIPIRANVAGGGLTYALVDSGSNVTFVFNPFQKDTSQKLSLELMNSTSVLKGAITKFVDLQSKVTFKRAFLTKDLTSSSQGLGSILGIDSLFSEDSLCFDYVASEITSSCKGSILSHGYTIPFYRTYSGSYTVNAKISGDDFLALFDTGAERTYIESDDCSFLQGDKFKNQKHEIFLKPGNSQTLERISIAGYKPKGLYVVDCYYKKSRKVPFIILGMDIIRKLEAFEIDNINSTMTFYKPIFDLDKPSNFLEYTLNWIFSLI